jgi:hypothetical protein
MRGQVAARKDDISRHLLGYPNRERVFRNGIGDGRFVNIASIISNMHGTARRSGLENGGWHPMCLLEHAAKESRNHPLEGFKDFRERKKNEKEPERLFVD